MKNRAIDGVVISPGAGLAFDFTWAGSRVRAHYTHARCTDKGMLNERDNYNHDDEICLYAGQTKRLGEGG